MVGKVYNDPLTNEIVVESEGGELIWSTSTTPLNILPSSQAIVYTGGIDFPEFDKDFQYGFFTQGQGPAPWYSLA